ncbi:OmpA family protein [Enterovibrio norvegicus]|uniref:OmpA family protein n=1 Tax=Enterovibrio norvegicus TaxID=188144 RepID=UPI00352BDA3C
MKPAFTLPALFLAMSVSSFSSAAAELSATVFEDICADEHTEVAFTVSLGQSTEVLFHRAQYLQLERQVDGLPATPLFIEALVNAGLNKKCAEFLTRETPTVKAHHNQLIAMVHFGFDKASLTSTGKKILSGIVDSIKRSNTGLSIEGHTDSIGSHTYNLQLGLHRAESVKQYLAASTGKGDTIATSSHGETQPIASNKSKAGQTQNRRVEVRVASTQGTQANHSVVKPKSSDVLVITP